MVIDVTPPQCHPFYGKLGFVAVFSIPLLLIEESKCLPRCIPLVRIHEERRKKGFSGRLEVEVMNTPVRVPPSQDFATQEWVWSAMAGLKKEYKISKSLRGNAQVLYNLFNPHYKSPYTDRLNMRIGIEYKIQKKKNKLPSD